MFIKKAYIILVHKNGDQLYRLLERLNDDHSFFFLHIDKNASLNEFIPAVNVFASKIKIVKRVAIEWGGFSLVQATLNAMNEIVDHATKYNWVILLSGQDYPIKSNEFINDFLSNTGSSAFFEFTQLPDHKRWSPGGGYFRINKYYLGMSAGKKLGAKALNSVSRFFPMLRRAGLKMMKPYAGSQWWMMNIETAQEILAFVKSNPRYYDFHKFTFAADEVFFHSIVLNLETMRGAIENNNMRFYIWPDTAKPHPEILNSSNLQSIINSDALFARKFDAGVDSTILDMVDNHCLSNNYA